MHYQILRAIFREFFSQLRLLRPVAMLHLAGCGLTKTCAHFPDAHFMLLYCLPCMCASFAERPQMGPRPAGAQIFPWCAINLELTRLDVSNNPELGFRGTNFSNLLKRLSVMGWIRREVYCCIRIGAPCEFPKASCQKRRQKLSKGAVCAEDSPMTELDLQGFSSFVRRSIYLEALQMHHTGVYRADVQPHEG